MDSFEQKSKEVINDVLAQFSEGRLFRGVNAEYDNQMGEHKITIKGNTTGLVMHDMQGDRITQKIFNAAIGAGIPVIHDTARAHNIQVSPRIKEGENHPDVLLKALVAYGKSEGNTGLIRVATEAMQELASYKEKNRQNFK